MIKSVTVFCGSKTGNNPLFAQHAEALGKLIAQNNIKLIYGGGNLGLMGVVANAVLKNNGEVIGVMPEVLNKNEHPHQSLTQMHVVEDMHARKKMMYELCDASIILPGGFGTMDELFEIITWNNLGIHEKKIILLNTAGYYNVLIEHIEQMKSNGFLYGNKDVFSIHNSPETIFLKDAGKYQNLHG